MKTLFTLLLLAGLGFGQSIVTVGGQTSWGDTLRWGDSDDSTHSLLVRGNAVYKDSSGTWVAITTDSCSKPFRVQRGSQRPVWRYELSYEVRASSGNTDSTQVKWRIDSRYCQDDFSSRGCESWVPAGRLKGDTTTIVTDSLVSVATTAGTTWKPTSQIYSVPRGSQIRFCVDSHQAGGATGDSTFYRRHINRVQ